MDEFSEQLSRWLQRGFEVWRDHALTLAFALLLAVSISLGTALILAGAVLAGYLAIVLALLDGGPTRPRIGDLLLGLRLFVPMLLYVVLVLAVTGVGIILSWIPFVGWPLAVALWVVFQTMTMFTVFFMVDRRQGLAEALRQSTEASSEAFLPALGLFCIAAAVGLSGCLILPAASWF